MASSDALPIPRKNVAYRVVFPIMDADGDLVTGATGLDSEVSKDQGTFADCTNEATEIATASGMYYLDLTSTEMNADCVAIIVKTTSSGAKTTPIVLYPEELGDMRVNVGQWNGTAVATPATAGIPDVNLKNIANAAVSTSTAQLGVNAVNLGGTAQTGRDIGASVLLSAGTGTGQLDFTSGVVKANLAQILGTALTETAGQIAAAFKQFFNIASPTSTMNAITAVTTVTNLTNAPTAGDLTATMKTSVTTAATAATPTPALAAKDSFVVRNGTAQAGAGSTITLDASASATDSLYVGAMVKIDSGTGAGQTRIITAYVGSTKVATVDRAWATNPDNTSVFTVIAHEGAKVDSSLQVSVGALAAGVITGASIAADAITDAKVAADVTIASVTGSVGSIATGGITSGSFAAGAIDNAAIAADAIGASELAASAIAEIADGVWDEDVTTHSTASSTGLALQNATAPSAATVADAVWDEALSGHLTGGSTGAALNAAGGAGDPWITTLPGSYVAGQAGYIVGNNLNATVSSRASQTSVDTIDDFVDTEVAAIKTQTDKMVFTVANQLDVNVIDWKGSAAPAMTGDAFARLGAPVGASISADIAAVQADTDNIQTRVPASLTGGRMDVSVGAYQTGLTPLQPTTAGRTLDVSVGGEAGVDWANVGSPSTAVSLSATTVATTTTLTNAPSDSSGTTTLLGRLTATRAGYLDNLSAGAVATASKLLKYVQLILRKDSAIATDNSAEVTEINANGGSGAGAYANTTDAQEALRDRGDAAWVTGTAPLDAAGTRAALGLTSANLDTQLTAIDDFIDTEVAAIKAKTDQMVFTVANQVDVNVVDWKGSAAPAMTGDAYARIGAAGAGLTALGDTRMANLDATVSSRSTLTAALVWSYVVEGSFTALNFMRLMAAALTGKISGAASTTVVVRNVSDTKAVITATVDADGNRSAVTLDGS